MASTARENAIELVPHFAKCVLAGRVHTYGYYAKLLGRDPEKHAIGLGPAFHAIGAACVYLQVPVAPLYYVRRDDNKRQDIFESDPLEARDVLPHLNLLYVAAREYVYSQADFDRLQEALSEKLPRAWSPHRLWHVSLVRCPKNAKETYFALALERYRDIVRTARPSAAGPMRQECQ